MYVLFPPYNKCKQTETYNNAYDDQDCLHFRLLPHNVGPESRGHGLPKDTSDVVPRRLQGWVGPAFYPDKEREAIETRGEMRSVITYPIFRRPRPHTDL